MTYESHVSSCIQHIAHRCKHLFIGPLRVCQVPAFAAAALTPPPLPEAVRLKWRRLLAARRLALEVSPHVPSAGHGWRRCLSEGPAHVALSADLAQLDGLIVTLSSAVRSSNVTRLCFHTFVLEQQKDFIVEGLRCAFREAFQELSEGAHDVPGGQVMGAYGIEGARLLIHRAPEQKTMQFRGADSCAAREFRLL